MNDDTWARVGDVVIVNDSEGAGAGVALSGVDSSTLRCARWFSSRGLSACLFGFGMNGVCHGFGGSQGRQDFKVAPCRICRGHVAPFLYRVRADVSVHYGLGV